ESTMLPAAAYTSPDVLAWERRHFFAASWVCLGRDEAVLGAGVTQVATTVGDVAVLLARAPARHEDRPRLPRRRAAGLTSRPDQASTCSRRVVPSGVCCSPGSHRSGCPSGRTPRGRSGRRTP
ncbi:MAG TPA: hypothetical protein VH857_13825, partial [Actinomycetes bacterium]|nr:hypothetical protein [Actinomycetes bacterium]